MNPNTENFIPFSRPVLGDEELEAVNRVMRSGWLTTGPETAAFEKEFAAMAGVPHALAVNSATAGLHLALVACGIKKGDKVVVPSYTFTASAEVVRYLNADIVFCDSKKDSWHMDPESLKTLINQNPEIKAVIPVHYGGALCDMEEILSLCRPKGIKIIEDAAHCFPSPVKGIIPGTIGDAGIFSFYANKTITTGEGGMLVCSDDEISEKVKIFRLHGISKDIWNRYTAISGKSWEYDIVEAGYKYNMSDMAAALGRVQLKKGEAFLKRRREIFSRYRDAFSGIKGLTLPPEAPEESHCHLFVIRINNQSPGTRDDYMEYMASEKIGTSLHYIPLHMMSYYKNLYKLKAEDFPNALHHFRQSVSLPALHSLKDEELERIIKCTIQWFGTA